MQKVIFGIFAHPDDESFGPGGTLLMETKHGAELHLLTLTCGQAGTNPDNIEDFGEYRRKEWQTTGQLLGATSMHDLGFEDGKLCNQTMPEAAQRIESIVQDTIAGRQDITVEFISIDLNGITGHIDHIVAGRAACLAFYRLKQHDPRFMRIRLSCIPHAYLPAHNIGWLYMEPGRKEAEIDEIVDARQYHDELVKIIRTHHSQRGDGDVHIERLGDQLGMNYFIVKT